MARHKHADLMVAFANDNSLTIECRRESSGNAWMASPSPNWLESFEYRIKPPDPVVQVVHGNARLFHGGVCGASFSSARLLDDNIKLTFTDGKLTKAEVV